MLASRKKLKDRPWLLLFLEAVIVCLSVFLALGLDSWRSTNLAEEMAIQTLDNFEREVRMNKEAVQESLEHHTALIDELLGDRRGINLQTALIRNNAWEIAQFTGAVSNLDFEIVDFASRIQEQQRQYQRIVESSTDLIYQGNFMDLENLDDERLQSALLFLVNRLARAEQQLIESYKDFLETIE